MSRGITQARLPAISTDGGVVLVGGTFDPPHGAHVTLSLRARSRLKALHEPQTHEPWLLYVPAAVSPFKVNQGATAVAPDRIAMLDAAVKGVDRASVWTEEIDRAERSRAEGKEPGPSYWIDTLRALRELVDVPGQKPALQRVKLWFIIGSDQAVQFHRWKAFREILAEAEPVVLLREPVGTRESLKASLEQTGVWNKTEIAWWQDRVSDVGLDDVSSTHIRELLARCAEAYASGGEDSAARAELERLLAPGVIDVIRERGLYGGAIR
jgi:nicotinate (nicotinamide) nucleotide adenylyltransferase